MVKNLHLKEHEINSFDKYPETVLISNTDKSRISINFSVQ
jgi:hypothetical protein